ncbi:hypothetical protein FRUB_00300 [Fimbriiglobus ruber]|uniref:Uncharacterized protein n=1 Tax=Fimbriiglobus ruber TaxID=1908690 RepID=A0A225DZ21_9BACT|nr:hypothetical protein FRUB_00300 [Fimbriiglobus ruber]
MEIVFAPVGRIVTELTFFKSDGEKMVEVVRVVYDPVKGVAGLVGFVSGQNLDVEL